MHSATSNSHPFRAGALSSPDEIRRAMAFWLDAALGKKSAVHSVKNKKKGPCYLLTLVKVGFIQVELKKSNTYKSNLLALGRIYVMYAIKKPKKRDLILFIELIMQIYESNKNG